MSRTKVDIQWLRKTFGYRTPEEAKERAEAAAKNERPEHKYPSKSGAFLACLEINHGYVLQLEQILAAGGDDNE